MKASNSIFTFGILLFSILLTSCSKSPKNLEVISKDVNIVGVIDIYAIAKKGQLDKLADNKLYRKTKKEVRGKNKKMSKLMDQFIDNPLLTGVNFTSDIYTFYIDNSKDERFAVISAELSDSKKFAEFTRDLIRKSGLDFHEEKETGYSYSLFGREALIGWDNDKAVVVIATNYRSRKNLDIGLDDLMRVREEDQISKTEYFKDFISRKKDVSVYVSSNIIEGLRGFEEFENTVDYNINDNGVAAFLSFDDDKISLNTKLYANEDVQKLQNENSTLDHSFEKDLLNYFPKENYFFSSASINLKEAYKLMEDNDIVIKQIERIERKEDLDFEELINSFGGSFVFSIIGFEEMEYTYMTWGHKFDPKKGVPLNTKYRISEAGYISYDLKERLNAGETVKGSTSSGIDYCFNIEEILAKGGDIESAIAKDAKVQWFKGGWSYGKNTEVERTDFLPLLSLSFDLNNNNFIKDLIDKIEGNIVKNGDYYEFSFENRYPSFLAFDGEKCIISNDLKSIKSFVKGGIEMDNLSNASYASDVTKSIGIFSTLNLDYDSYDKEIKKKLKDEQNTREYKVFKIWSELGQRITLKSEEFGAYELELMLKPQEFNSLHTIINAGTESINTIQYE